MSKNRVILASVAVVLWSILMVGWTNAAMEECKEAMNKVEMCYDKEDGVYRIFSKNKENFVVVADRNLWANERGANWYIYQWWNNYWFSEKNFKATKEFAIWNNKFNNVWYNFGDSFVIRTKGDYRSNNWHHDWLWWWTDDVEDNNRWMNLITWGTMYENTTYDVYDVDIFRQWPCPEWFHVPSYWDWLELLGYLTGYWRSISELDFPNEIVFRNFEEWHIEHSDNYMVWTSSPVRDSKMAIAVTKSGYRVDVSRSMWLQVRCFQNKRDAMVWVTDMWSDVVFYDTEKPSIQKWSRLGTNFTLLDGSGSIEFKQPIKLEDFVKWRGEKGYLYLSACTNWENSLNTSDLKLSGFNNVDLGIECDLEVKAVNFDPRAYSVLHIYATWDIIGNNTISSCAILGSTDDKNRIYLNVLANFVKDFATNKSLFTGIMSDFIYAPTEYNGNPIWNYIYTWSHVLNTWIDWDEYIVTDDDLILWWYADLLSAQPISSDNLECFVITWSSSLALSGLNPKCEVVSTSKLDWVQMWIIHSCWSINCESRWCYDWVWCRWNHESSYEKINAPFLYTNKLHITWTWNTYQLTSGDVWTIKISLKNKVWQSCYSRNDWTNSTYVQIRFKKIISPYKAWYLSGDVWWVRYTQKNLWNAIASWWQDKWIKWYISNVQTIKSWNMSWWALGKVNYMINLSQPVADENYNIGWEATVGDYRAEINIQRPTSDNEENPDAYKSRFPSY